MRPGVKQALHHRLPSLSSDLSGDAFSELAIFLHFGLQAIPVRDAHAYIPNNPLRRSKMTRKKLLAAALAATLSTGMIVTITSSAFAAESQPAAMKTPVNDQATNKAEEKEFVEVSEDTQTSMHDMHGARLAIFNGHPEEARTYVDAAVTRIGDAIKDADKYALDIKAPKAGDRYVPFDSELAVLNDYKPTATKAKYIAKANVHLHNGKQKEAIETLKLADIGVAVTTRLVPIQFAKEHLEQAAKLVAEHKYYEANIALKAVDGAVVVETYTIDAVPKTKAKANS
jgi:hypothetical protein